MHLVAETIIKKKTVVLQEYIGAIYEANFIT